MDDKSWPKGIASIGNIAEEYTDEYGTDGLYFRLTKMEEHKRDHLYWYARFPEPVLKAKEQETSEYELPGEQTNCRLPYVGKHIELFNSVVLDQ